MFTIEFIVPYKSLVSVAEEAFAEHPKQNEIKFLIHPVGIDDVKKSSLTGDIIIARGLTAAYLNLLKQNKSVIELPMSGYDILRAINEGVTRCAAKKIALIATANAVYGMKNFSLRFFPPVKTYEICPSDDLDACIEQAISDGADLIIGGDSVSTRASKWGYPSVRIETGKESVRQAIDEAWRLFHSNLEERMRVQRLNALVEHVHEGIIAVDSEQRITICNQYAEQLLHVQLHDILGKYLEEALPVFKADFSLLKQPVLGDFLDIEGTQIAVNRVPVLINETFVAGILTLQQLSQIQKIESRIRKEAHKKGLVATYDFSQILGSSASIREAINLAKSYARVQSNILLVGETGTGKELFAQSIHNASSRKGGPFVAVNCAALPESLLESELFGYVSGAFTGAAKEGKMGMFELAHGGTIFLDEISEMSMHLQGRLLRVIEEREIMRLGHDTVIPVDIRIIAATNKSLEDLVTMNRFRKDLFYRLDVLRLNVPPLRDRVDDIPLLMNHFLVLYDTINNGAHHTLDVEAIAFLLQQKWDGNIRQLRNLCERLSVVVTKPSISEQDVLFCLGCASLAARESFQKDKGERESIIIALKRCGNNKTQAARLLGMNRTTLYRKITRYKMDNVLRNSSVQKQQSTPIAE